MKFKAPYIPAVVATLSLGYLGLLYGSYWVDTHNEQKLMNIKTVNLAEHIPKVDDLKDSVLDSRTKLFHYIGRIHSFESIVKEQATEKQSVTKTLKVIPKQPKSNKHNKKKKSEKILLSQPTEIKKTRFYHVNRIVFQEKWMYDMLRFTPKLDLESKCLQLGLEQEEVRRCREEAILAEDRLRLYIYKNNLGNKD